jgi:hypothetical protein
MADIEYEFKSEFNERYSIVARKIIRLLSKDSRLTISDIAKTSIYQGRKSSSALRGLKKSLA